jgi:hypothetical protein
MRKEKEMKKWENRAKLAKGILVGPGGEICGASWDEIKLYQKEFQKEFCPSCVHFDLEKNDFKEKGHPNDPNDCKHHYTDIIGQCWNYRKRGKQEKGRIETIKLQQEPMRKGRLTRKLTTKEYPWLPKDLEKGTVVYRYFGYTYGVIGSGIAVTLQPDKTPFFEVPADAVEWIE